MAYRLTLLLLISALVAIGSTTVNIRAWDTDYLATSDTSGIDSVLISQASLGDTAITVSGLTLLGSTIRLDLPEIWRDSVLSITTYYDTSVYSFVSPVDYRPLAGDTLYAELVNDTIDANVVSINGNAGSADSLNRLFNGLGARMKLTQLVIHNNSAVACSISTVGSGKNAIGIGSTNGNAMNVYAGATGFNMFATDTAISMYSGLTGVRIRSNNGKTIRLESDNDDGVYITSKETCISATSDSNWAFYLGGYDDAVRIESSRGSGIAINGLGTGGVNAGITIQGANYGTYINGVNNYGLAITSDVSYAIRADSCKLGGDIRVDYTDTVNYIPEVSAYGDTNLFNMATLATATQLTDAQDSVISAIALDVDTNTINILTVQDSIVSAVGLVSDSSAIAGLLDSAFFSIEAGSLYVHGGYIDTVMVTIAVIGTVLADINVNVVSPYAYATNRVRLENMNTPIKWAQAEQDTIKWDIDTTYNLAIYDSVIATFRAWQSRGDTTTLIYKTLNIDTLNNTASLYIEESETDSLSSGNYPADLWLDRYYGSDIIKSQIWSKTIQIDRSSRGTR